MSEERQNQFANWASILTVPLLMALAGWVHLEINGAEAHADAGTAQLRQEMTATYETQAAHTQDIATIKQWNQNLSEGEQNIKLNVQRLTDLAEQQQNKHN